jgi:peptidoglycan/LPS O-acetylase OafA/YrhL
MINNFEEQFNKKSNIFDLIRLTAAFGVLLSHGIYLLPFNSKKDTDPIFLLSQGLDNIGSWCVIIFFSISGFLITESWLRNPNFFIFLKKRVLRIYPALVTCIIITMFIIGPLLTINTLENYWNYGFFWNYLNNIFLVIGKHIDTLPGLFLSNRGAQSVNISLWSLHVEFFAYIGIACLGFINLKKIRLILFFLSLLSFWYYLTIVSPSNIGNNIYQQIGSNIKISTPLLNFNNFDLILKYSTVFLVGSLIRLFAKEIKYNLTLIISLIILFIILVHRTSTYQFSVFFVLPTISISLGLIFSNKIYGFFKKYGDISYGIYIYHHLIMQIIIAIAIQKFNYKVEYFLLLIISIPITILVAYCSWKYVEKPFIKIKYT